SMTPGPSTSINARYRSSISTPISCLPSLGSNRPQHEDIELVGNCMTACVNGPHWFCWSESNGEKVGVSNVEKVGDVDVGVDGAESDRDQGDGDRYHDYQDHQRANRKPF